MRSPAKKGNFILKEEETTMSNAVANQNEVDIQLKIMGELLNVPHRDLMKVYNTHVEMFEQDPMFYAHLASWAVTGNNSIRDHQEVFIIVLLLAKDEIFRNVGLAMLRDLPHYQVGRVINFISGEKKRVNLWDVKDKGGRTLRTIDPRELKKEEERKAAFKLVKGQKLEKRTIVESKGLFKNVPRSVRTEVSRYLKDREDNVTWFDATVVRAKSTVKRLYSLLHIAPGDRAQAILFDDNPPENSTAAMVKELAKASDPTEQAKLIIEKRIPYTIASTVVTNMTPTIMLALIEVMSDVELINNMGALKSRGVFDNEDLKKLVTERLEKAKLSKKGNALKGLKAAEAAGLSDDLTSQLKDVANDQLRSKGRITRPTALLIDKSSSMDAAIEIGKQMAAAISAVCDSDFYCYAFNNIPVEITPPNGGKTLGDWSEAFKYVKAGGMTGCGAPMRALQNAKRRVEQVVMITDEAENQPPAFLKAFQEYSAAMGVEPSVTILRCGNWRDEILNKLKRAGIEAEAYEVGKADYNSIPSLVQYLLRPSKLDLLMEIVNTKLPQRKLPKQLEGVA